MPKHNSFSNAAMRDMVRAYAQENFYGREVLKWYSQMYPDAWMPDFNLVKKLYDRLGESGTFHPNRTYARRILVHIAENPEKRTRGVPVATRISKSWVFEIFHEEVLYPCHFILVQQLSKRDLAARLKLEFFWSNK